MKGRSAHVERGAGPERIDALAAHIARLLGDPDRPHDAALKAVARQIGDHFGGSCSLFFFAHGAALEIVPPGHEPSLDALFERYLDTEDGEDGSRVLQVARQGKSLVLAVDDPEELSAWIDRRAQTLARHTSVTSIAVVPLSGHGRTFGAICVMRRVGARALGEPDRKALEAVGARIAGAIENERLVDELHRELHAQAGVREELHEARERFAAAFAHAPVALALLSVAPERMGQITESNLGLAEIFGCAPEDLRDTDLESLSHPDDLDVGVEGIPRLFAGEIGRHEVEKRFVRFDGGVIHARLVVTLVRRPGGTPLYGVCMLEDVTERRRAEDERGRLAAFVESSRDAIVAWNREGLIIGWNAAAERLFGHPADVAVGRDSRFLIPEADRGLHEERRARVLAGQELPEHGSHRLTADRRVVDVGVTMSPIRNIAGEIVGHSSILRDLSERRRMEGELAASDARYRAIVEMTTEGVWLLDREGVTTFVNDRMAEMAGVPRQEMIGRRLLDFVPPEHRHISEANLRAQHRAGSRQIERELLRPDGSSIWVLVGVTSMHDADGRYSGILGVATDITERRRAELDLAERAANQEAVAALGRAALAGQPMATLLRTAVEAVRDRLGVDDVHYVETLPGADAGAGSGVWHMADPPVAPHGRPIDAAALRGLAERFPGGSGVTVEHGSDLLEQLWPDRAAAIVCTFAVGGEGSPRLLLACSSAPRDFRAHEVAFVEAVGNVLAGTLRRQGAEAQLRTLAIRDELTGLANRALFEERLQHALRRSVQERSMVAVVLINLDRFRVVNDAAGRAAGDALLVEVARRLQEGLDPADTLARLDADEFALIRESVDGERDAIATAQRQLDRLLPPLTVGGRPVSLDASAGVVLDDGGRATAEELLRDADVALQRAKHRGGARLEVFDDEMRHRVLERLRLEHDLRKAVEEGQLRLYFQPMVSLLDRRVVGLEALLRWEHSELGLVPPSAFLPVAESSGLVVEVGRWALKEMCRQVGRWEAAHRRDLPYVSIDVSARELADPGYPDEFARMLRRAGVTPDRIVLEVKETALQAEAGNAMAVLQRLDDAGVHLLLDDFGMGVAPISQLRHLRVAGLKLDAALVGGIGVSDRDRRIVGSVAAMASALEIDAIATGVETSDQAVRLLEAGCHVVQGPLVARPGPAASVEALLADPTGALTHVWRLLDATTPARHAAEVSRSPAVPQRPPPAAARGSLGKSLGLNDAARALGVSASTLRRWADSGRIETVRTPGGHRRFAAAEVARMSRAAAPVTAEVTVRGADFPGGPVPALGDVVRGAGERLAVAAGRAVYEGDSTGWFRSEEGQTRILRWLEAIAEAAGTGEYGIATDASRGLVAEARSAGATLLERHLLVERFAELALRSMQQRDAERDDLVNARRLFLKLRQLILAETAESLD